MLREKLLELDDDLGVKPSEYAMALIPFKNIMLEHGTTEGLKILAYVYYMRDARSLFAGYNEGIRHNEVNTKIFKGLFKVDRFTEAALEMYNEAETSTLKLLRAARSSIDKLEQWLEAIDISDDDYDPVIHTRVLESMGKTVEALKKLEEAALAESTTSENYGGVQINKYSE